MARLFGSSTPSANIPKADVEPIIRPDLLPSVMVNPSKLEVRLLIHKWLRFFFFIALVKFFLAFIIRTLRDFLRVAPQYLNARNMMTVFWWLSQSPYCFLYENAWNLDESCAISIRSVLFRCCQEKLVKCQAEREDLEQRCKRLMQSIASAAEVY